MNRIDNAGGRIGRYLGPPPATWSWPVRRRRPLWSVAAAVTAGLVVVAGLLVAVPCGVYAIVGLWFGDRSVPAAAVVAAASVAVVLAAAGVAVVVGSRPRRPVPQWMWN